MARSCEHGNERSGLLESVNFVGWLRRFPELRSLQNWAKKTREVLCNPRPRRCRQPLFKCIFMVPINSDHLWGTEYMIKANSVCKGSFDYTWSKKITSQSWHAHALFYIDISIYRSTTVDLTYSYWAVRLGLQLSCLIFYTSFLSPSTKFFWFHYHRFLSYPFRFIIYLPFHHSTLQFNCWEWRQVTHKEIRSLDVIYRVSQEERSIFWEVIVSVIVSKKQYIYMCLIPNGFRDTAIALCSTP
jgi:hypothetical protein